MRAVFDATGTCQPYCGLLVPYVPDLVLRGDAAFFADLPGRLAHEPVRATLGYGVSYVGRRPLPYGQTSDVIFLSDASLGVGWTIWNVRLAGQNIFDARYRLGEYNYASNFQAVSARPHARSGAFVHRRRAADGDAHAVGDVRRRGMIRRTLGPAALVLGVAAISCNGTTGDDLLTFPCLCIRRPRARPTALPGRRLHHPAHRGQDAHR